MLGHKRTPGKELADTEAKTAVANTSDPPIPIYYASARCLHPYNTRTTTTATKNNSTRFKGIARECGAHWGIKKCWPETWLVLNEMKKTPKARYWNPNGADWPHYRWTPLADLDWLLLVH